MGKRVVAEKSPSLGSERRCAPARVCPGFPRVCACARAYRACAPARGAFMRARLYLACVRMRGPPFPAATSLGRSVKKCDCPQSEMAALVENGLGGASLAAVPTAAARWRARIVDGSDRISGFLLPFPRWPCGPGVLLALGLKQAPLTISVVQAEARERKVAGCPTLFGRVPWCQSRLGQELWTRGEGSWIVHQRGTTGQSFLL